MFPLTFDWAQIAYIGSPLLTPWWAAANIVTGLVIVIWAAAPILCKYSAPFSLLFMLIHNIRLQKCSFLRLYAYSFHGSV
jgi:hypothetical protein